MKLVRYTDTEAFYQHVQPFLLACEAENNLVLGIAQRLYQNPDYYGDNQPYLGLVEHEENVVGVILRTPPHPVVFSHVTHPDAIPLAVEDLHNFYGSLPGVQAEKVEAKRFAELWFDRTRQAYVPDMQLRIYRLEQVEPPSRVRGSLREATAEDRDLLVAWTKGFYHDAFSGYPTDVASFDAGAIVDRYLQPESSGLYVWEDGVPVSMAGHTGPTPNGMRINMVYTPPAYRKRGYASACVAALSQLMLDSGYRFCFLFTDLANPTSNSIYQKIGYEPVCDVDKYAFGEW